MVLTIKTTVYLKQIEPKFRKAWSAGIRDGGPWTFLCPRFEQNSDRVARSLGFQAQSPSGIILQRLTYFAGQLSTTTTGKEMHDLAPRPLTEEKCERLT